MTTHPLTPMRWLFHVKTPHPPLGDGLYAPASLAQDGFIHASFRDAVLESARRYFPPTEPLEVLQVDPRRLDVPLVLAETPRGPMPHIHGPIPPDAVVAAHPLAAFERLLGQAAVPDAVTGTRFGFVAFEGMTLLDLVGVYDPLSRIRSMQLDPTSTSEVVAFGGPRVFATDGAEITVQRVWPPLTDFDVLVVPGGPATRTLLQNAPFLAWLQSFPRNRLIASVCTGSLLLAAAGRLVGKRATTHHTARDELRALGVDVSSERVVDEGQVVTAGGVTSGLDLGVHLVRRLVGDEAARTVARQMEWGAA
jgi:putative intracellular protease/amidase/uncharacterized protein (DUF952 family)